MSETNTVERPVGLLVPERADGELWEAVMEDEFPTKWCDAVRYRVVCSNGFVGQYGIESALRHKPASWPECFPAGADSESCCTLTVQRKQPNAEITAAQRAG